MKRILDLLKQSGYRLLTFIIQTLTPVVRLTAKFSIVVIAFYLPYKVYSLFPKHHHKAIANDIHNVQYANLNSPSKLNPIIKLHLFLEEGEGYCTGFVVDATHAFTAAHCTPGLITNKTFATDETETSHIAITDYHANVRADFAVLIGDFSRFNAIIVSTQEPVVMKLVGYPIASCGYPEGQKHLVCSVGQLQAPMDSHIYALGEMYPGMSGGPVLVDVPGLDPIAFAVNTGTMGEGDLNVSATYLSPLLGITAL